jgi:hypothetical protein
VAPDADEPLEEFYGDDRLADPPAPPTASTPPPPASPARRMPVAGALMAGIALGLRDVLEPKHQDRIAIEQDAPGQPLEPQRYEVHLDIQDPTSSFAIYRPWVESDSADEAPAPEDEP